MRVRVHTLRRHGRQLKREDFDAVPPFVGVLKVTEARDHELSRPVIRAKLVDITTGTETDVLPELSDARLLWLEKEKMRLTGFERIGGIDYAQTWSVERL